MTDNGTSNELTSTGRKRTPHEIGHDRAMVAQMYFKAGLSHQQIADELNRRPGIGYQLSRRMIGYDIESILDSWVENQENPDYWVAEAVQRTRWVEIAAWEGWERSLSPKESKTVKKGYHGIRDFEEATDFYENSVGDKGFLKIILDAIRDRNRLLGIGAARLHIDQHTEHIIKTYSIVSPSDWDIAIDGEWSEKEKLTSGNDS